MIDLLIISLGAIVGANARYLLSRFAAKELGPVFPYGTLFINIAGSLMVGFFVVWTTERVLTDARWRLLIVEGVTNLTVAGAILIWPTISLNEWQQLPTRYVELALVTWQLESQKRSMALRQPKSRTVAGA